MNNLFKYICFAVFVIALAGCTTRLKIKEESRSVKTDVFAEVSKQETPPEGLVYVAIKASIKKARVFHESEESLHKESGYPFLINIDGQAVIWEVDAQYEVKPRGDKNNLDPEGGKGIKYILDKKLILPAGAHKIFFGLPEETYIKEVRATLKEGEVYILEFKPVYSHRRSWQRHFVYGLSDYEVFLNGNPSSN